MKESSIKCPDCGAPEYYLGTNGGIIARHAGCPARLAKTIEIYEKENN